jgi:hypothetical protein
MNTNPITLLATIATIMVLMTVNGLSLGDPKDVGEHYIHNYSKCVQWNPGAKGIPYCGKSIPMQEIRVNTVREGLIMNDNSYRVVN